MLNLLETVFRQLNGERGVAVLVRSAKLLWPFGTTLVSCGLALAYGLWISDSEWQFVKSLPGLLMGWSRSALCSMFTRVSEEARLATIRDEAFRT